MFKLIATIQKDVRILTRDKVGLLLMFVMPILLVLIIASVQNSTFELVNNNKIPLLLYNKDTATAGKQLVQAIENAGMFELTKLTGRQDEQFIKEKMHDKDAMVAVVIPGDFSAGIISKAKSIAAKALQEFELGDSSDLHEKETHPLTLYYHPVLQQSFRQSIEGALQGAVQLVQSKQIVQHLYLSVNQKAIPDSLEKDIVKNSLPIMQVPVSRDGSRNIPNTTQHNIPAWTIFAMFFIVVSLGSSVVREKQSGSFVRLKTLPTNYLVSLVSKQVTYIGVTLAQALVIFSIGVWLFPLIGLPKLVLPNDLVGLVLVTVICGWCAASYAICIGVLAQTQEQANGFGAISIVMLAAIGGLLVPSFAMPESFMLLMKISPLHWCLEAYYGLFLEGSQLKDILMNIIPLLVITVFFQLLTVIVLKRKNLI